MVDWLPAACCHPTIRNARITRRSDDVALAVTAAAAKCESPLHRSVEMPGSPLVGSIVKGEHVMAELRAMPLLIQVAVHATPPEEDGKTEIEYFKDFDDELWEMMPGKGWTQINPHVELGKGDDVAYRGSLIRRLRPGQVYRVGAWRSEHGPVSRLDSVLVAPLVVVVAMRKEERTIDITPDMGGGGTWYGGALTTLQPVVVGFSGVNLTPPEFDINHLPTIETTEHPDLVSGQSFDSWPPGTPKTLSRINFQPLVPGQRYWLTIVVVDEKGYWGLAADSFVTLGRKINVSFPKIKVFDDGDNSHHGEAEFWFSVSAADGNPPRSKHELFNQHWPQMKIDDWSHTGRPYPINVAYIEDQAVAVPPDRPRIVVASRGIEHDDIGSNEHAGDLTGHALPLPVGREEAVSGTLEFECRPATDGSTFRYSVTVDYTAEYFPI